MSIKKTALTLMLFSCVYAKTVTIDMYVAQESGIKAGTITATDTKYGLMLKPNLYNLSSSLTPGIHGLHIHVNPSCNESGMAAGGHLDPKNTKHHMGPYVDEGHLGDLPAIYITNKGTSNLPVVAPRLYTKDILGHSLMIHNGGDNYNDTPALGGGGSRMICGVIPAKTQ